MMAIQSPLQSTCSMLGAVLGAGVAVIIKVSQVSALGFYSQMQLLCHQYSLL